MRHRYCKDIVMRATGIPKTIAISKHIGEVEKGLEAIGNNVLDADRRASDRQIELCNDLPKMMVREILYKVLVEGAIPISLEDLHRAINDNSDALISKNIESMINNRFNALQVATSNCVDSSNVNVASSNNAVQLGRRS